MPYWKRNSLLLLIALLIVPAFLVDRSVLIWVKDFYGSNPDFFRSVQAVDPFIKFISNGGTLIAIALLLFAAGRFCGHSLLAPGKTLFLGIISAGVTVQVIKHLIGRARPRITLDTVFIGPTLKGGYDSFPSGHTTIAFCFACILSRYYPKGRVPFYLFAVLVGVDRIQGFHHFPSDVVGGIILGTLVGMFFTGRETRPGPAGA